MNTYIIYIAKLWGYLQKLFKPGGEDLLVISKQQILPANLIDKNVSENNIAQATNIDFISQYSFDEGSAKVRKSLGTESGLVLDSCIGSSAVVRQATEAQSKRCRTAAERVSNKPRTSVEAESNSTRTVVEEDKSRVETSDFLLTNFGLTPASPRVGVESAFGRLRVKQHVNSKPTRSQVNENRVKGRMRSEDSAKTVSIRAIPSFNLIRTLFYLRASLHRVCIAFFSSLHREKDCASVLQVLCNYEETYKRVKRRLKESTNPLPTMYCLSTVNVLERYRKGTTKVLESYQRATNGSNLTVDVKANSGQVQRFNRPSIAKACVKHCICIDKAWIVYKTVPIYALSTLYERFIYASSILNPYFKSALSQISVFKRLKSLSQVFDRLDYDRLSESLKRRIKLTQGGGEGVGNKAVVGDCNFMNAKIQGILDKKKSLFSKIVDAPNVIFRKGFQPNLLLKCVLLLSIFSGLQISPLRSNAQIFVQSNERSLYIGDRVPNEFYTAKHKMIDWKTQKTYERNFEEYRDKLIILDFWASWCSPCLGSLKHLDEIIPQLDSSKVVVIPVNYESVDKMQQRLDHFQWHHQSVYDDVELMTLFPHAGIPHMVWIKNGEVIAMPLATYASVENINKTIDNHVPLMVQNLNVKTADYKKPLFQKDNAPAKILYQDGVLKVAGYTMEYAEQSTEITKNKDSIFITMMNQPLDIILYSVFEHKISNFLGPFDGALKFAITADKNSLFLQSKPRYSDAGDYGLDSKVLEWDRQNLYSLDYRVPATMTDEQIGDGLRSRITDFMLQQFGITIHIAYTTEKSYPLVKLKGTKEETLKRLSQRLSKRNDQSYYQYFPDPANGKKMVKILSLLLSKVKGLKQDYNMAQDRTGLPEDFNYSYEIPVDLLNAKEMTMEDVTKFADQFNLKIEYERRPLPYLLIENLQH